MNRLEYQRDRAIGTIVNLGCGDDPAAFGERATHVDVDAWAHPNFVRADVHALPFGDGSFDTAVLGDVLEHCTSPGLAVSEACRVARLRVVLTIPEEVLLPSVGTHVELGLSMRAAHYRKVHGYSEGMGDEEVVVAHKRTHPLFVDAYSEERIPHDGHINRFDEAWVDALVMAAALHGFAVAERLKVPEGTWENWLVLLVREMLK